MTESIMRVRLLAEQSAPVLEVFSKTGIPVASSKPSGKPAAQMDAAVAAMKKGMDSLPGQDGPCRHMPGKRAQGRPGSQKQA
eukprot:2848144-Lingulodinium_polyedra.AAC.1